MNNYCVCNPHTTHYITRKLIRTQCDIGNMLLERGMWREQSMMWRVWMSDWRWNFWKQRFSGHKDRHVKMWIRQHVTKLAWCVARNGRKQEKCSIRLNENKVGTTSQYSKSTAKESTRTENVVSQYKKVASTRKLLHWTKHYTIFAVSCTYTNLPCTE